MARGDDPIWRPGTDGGDGVTLVATGVALAALGIDPEGAPVCADGAAPAARQAQDPDAGPAAATGARSGSRAQCPGRQQASAADRDAGAQPEGATIAQMIETSRTRPCLPPMPRFQSSNRAQIATVVPAGAAAMSSHRKVSRDRHERLDRRLRVRQCFLCNLNPRRANRRHARGAAAFQGPAFGQQLTRRRRLSSERNLALRELLSPGTGRAEVDVDKARAPGRTRSP